MIPYFLRKLISMVNGEDYEDRGVLMPGIERRRQWEKNLAVGPRVLDVGTGSGILARMAFEKGAREVTAIDINPQAVERAKKLVPDATVLESDLFEKVEGKFDTIIFAAPWSEGEIGCHFHHALFDKGVVARFLKEAKGYLQDGGYVYIQYSDESKENYRQFLDAMDEEGYHVKSSWEYERWGRLTKERIRIILYRLGLKD